MVNKILFSVYNSIEIENLDEVKKQVESFSTCNSISKKIPFKSSRAQISCIAPSSTVIRLALSNFLPFQTSDK